VLIYQGYRIASLSSAGSSTSCIPQLVAQDSSLRATALWYPTVPSSDLCLNDESFTGESPLTAGYRPLVWIHFGGPNGTYLQSLTEISSILSVDSIHSIHFSYENEEVSKEVGKLGHRSIRAESKFGWLSDRRFSIDGPGGELIDSVEVKIKREEGNNVPSFYRHGRLTSLKVSNLT
jgi:hypothetical protein